MELHQIYRLVDLSPFSDRYLLLDQLSAEDEIVTQRIASVRVHVERTIARIKSFRILKQVFPLKSIEQLDKIWTICSYTSLFMPPLINETEKNKINVT